MRFRPRGRAARCPMCQALLPPPRHQTAVFSTDGCLGGRCPCGAVYVLDDTGRSGGPALLDAQALACDGDLDRALGLDAARELEVRRHPPLPAVEPAIWAVRFRQR